MHLQLPQAQLPCAAATPWGGMLAVLSLLLSNNKHNHKHQLHLALQHP